MNLIILDHYNGKIVKILKPYSLEIKRNIYLNNLNSKNLDEILKISLSLLTFGGMYVIKNRMTKQGFEIDFFGKCEENIQFIDNEFYIKRFLKTE